jgi:hypothetical protein
MEKITKTPSILIQRRLNEYKAQSESVTSKRRRVEKGTEIAHYANLIRIETLKMDGDGEQRKLAPSDR